MATLIVEHLGRRRAAAIDGRVLIGRRPSSGVAIDHADVSRLHAWIDRSGDGYYLGDVRSRTGTKLNGIKVRERVVLADGDEIVIGPVILRFSMASAPAEIERFTVTPEGTSPQSAEPDILFACTCGAPIWVPKRMAGRKGTCQHCGSALEVPGGKAAPLRQLCGVCQSHIDSGEETAHCPACALMFHKECWIENRGCSAYGCSQVNALDPNHRPVQPVIEEEEPQEETEQPDASASVAPAPAQVPWEFILLLASVLGSVLGAVTFGVPALLVGGGSIVYALRKRQAGRRGILALSATVCALGVVAGVIVSRAWWLNAPLPAWAWGRK